MAGGRFAGQVMCMTCAGDGVVTRADRVYEGIEDDQYRCSEGHTFGIDWSRGAPDEPQWPLADEVVAAIEASAERPKIRNKVPDTKVRRFVHGVATEPAEGLLRWLEGVGERTRLRLPVVLVRGQVGFSLRDARVGGGADALIIRCSDTALGVGLAERARQAAGEAPECALWLEGFWRGGEERVFAVVKVGEAIAAEGLATAGAELEVE